MVTHTVKVSSSGFTSSPLLSSSFSFSSYHCCDVSPLVSITKTRATHCIRSNYERFNGNHYHDSCNKPLMCLQVRLSTIETIDIILEIILNNDIMEKYCQLERANFCLILHRKHFSRCNHVLSRK